MRFLYILGSYESILSNSPKSNGQAASTLSKGIIILTFFLTFHSGISLLQCDYVSHSFLSDVCSFFFVFIVIGVKGEKDTKLLMVERVICLKIQQNQNIE